MCIHMIFEKNSMDKSCSQLLAYVFAYVSGGASYVFAYVFLYVQLLSAVCCCCCFVRCMPAGFYWLLTAADAPPRVVDFIPPTHAAFCLRSPYVLLTFFLH